jgi:hypothetical protein
VIFSHAATALMARLLSLWLLLALRALCFLAVRLSAVLLVGLTMPLLLIVLALTLLRIAFGVILALLLLALLLRLLVTLFIIHCGRSPLPKQRFCVAEVDKWRGNEASAWQERGFLKMLETWLATQNCRSITTEKATGGTSTGAGQAS